MHFLPLSPLHGVFGASPLYHICSDSNNYASNGTYDTNLSKLMASLFYRVPSTGFGLDSIGKLPDHTYGVGLCRGDVSSTNCKSCILDASIEIRKSCPNDKEAIIWYDYCLFKYSNDNFFYKIDINYNVYMYNTQNVSNLASFNYKTKEWLNLVATEAYQSSKMYATRELVLNGSEKFYGLAQCTRDLSKAHCKDCLDNAISDLPNCCDGKQGGRVPGGSCNIRYELYPFINS